MPKYVIRLSRPYQEKKNRRRNLQVDTCTKYLFLSLFRCERHPALDFLRLETNYALKLTISNSFPEYVAKIFPTLLNNQGTVLERSTYAILFSRLHVKINIASRVSSHSCFTASCNPLATCPTNRYIILERESAKKRDQPIDASKVRVFCVYSGSPRTSSF